ncbi:MAG: hypothetical protein ACOY9Y_09615 [Bacillota bacterium]
MRIFAVSVQPEVKSCEPIRLHAETRAQGKKVEVDEIETAHINLLRRLIRNKKFVHYLVKKRYLIAIDGTQKFTLGECWGEEYLKRHVKGKDEEPQYYVYLLEAKLVFPGGLVLPLMSVLDNTFDKVTNKQDCELKAFKRLAGRLKSISLNFQSRYC